MALFAAVLLLFAPALCHSQESAVEHAARVSAAAAANADPARAGNDALKAFSLPRQKDGIKAAYGIKRLNLTTKSPRPTGEGDRRRRWSGSTQSSAPSKQSGFLRSASRYIGGLLKIPLFGALSTLRTLTKLPGHMARGFKEGRLLTILDPLKAVIDVGWNAVTVIGAELNHAVSPLYALADPGQGPGEVRYSDGMVWTSGGPGGGIIHAIKHDRFRYFMPSSAVVFADKEQVDCDCNPVNPGDIYDNNAVNALHEVIIRDRRPIGYFTNFALPWILNKKFRRAEEESALQEAIDRLYPR